MDANIWLSVIGASLPSLAAVGAFVWRTSAMLAHVEHQLADTVTRLAAVAGSLADAQKDLNSLDLIRHRLANCEEKLEEHTSVHVRVKLLESQVQRLSMAPPANPAFSLRPPRHPKDE